MTTGQIDTRLAELSQAGQSGSEEYDRLVVAYFEKQRAGQIAEQLHNTNNHTLLKVADLVRRWHKERGPAAGFTAGTLISKYGSEEREGAAGGAGPIEIRAVRLALDQLASAEYLLATDIGGGIRLYTTAPLSPFSTAQPVGA